MLTKEECDDIAFSMCDGMAYTDSLKVDFRLIRAAYDRACEDCAKACEVQGALIPVQDPKRVHYAEITEWASAQCRSLKH